MREHLTEDLGLLANSGIAGLGLFLDSFQALRDVVRVRDEQLELELLEVAPGSPAPEKPSATARSASTCRRPPEEAGPVPGTSWTRTAAGVSFRAPTSAPTRSSRSSAIVAMPTFDLSV